MSEPQLENELSIMQQVISGAPEACHDCPVVKEFAFLNEFEVKTGRVTLEAVQTKLAQRVGRCGLGPRTRPGLRDGMPSDYCQNPGSRRY